MEIGGRLTGSELEGEYESLFVEPFIAFGRGEDTYFVTESGKVYRFAKGADGKPAVTPVWDDGRRSVEAVVSDSATGRHFAFLKSEWTAGPTYFEMSPRPEPRRYDDCGVRPLDPADQTPGLLDRARVLIAAKLIDPAAKMKP